MSPLSFDPRAQERHARRVQLAAIRANASDATYRKAVRWGLVVYIVQAAFTFGFVLFICL